MERAVLICHGERMEAPACRRTWREVRIPTGEATRQTSGWLKNQERQLFTATLEQTDWNKYQAAQVLGISRSTLYGKIERFSLEKPAPRAAEGV